VIDWAKNKCDIDNLLLNPSMNQILEIKISFDNISFYHIFREYNTKIDQLAKEAILL
jgi:hypothetical protein